MSGAVHCMEGNDRRDAITPHFDLIGMHVQEKMNVPFRPDDVQLLLVVVVHGGLGISSKAGVEFPDEITQSRVGGEIDLPVKVNAYFRAVVAAKHGTSLYQRHLQSEPCRRDSCARAGYAASDDNQIEIARVLGLLRQTEHPLAKSRHRLIFLRRVKTRIG